MAGNTPPQQYTFQHKKLGGIVGLTRGSDIVQFRGIPYAQIPARFRQSSLRTHLPSQPFDARKPGPICPQPSTITFPQFWSGPPASDGLIIAQPLADEFECLNLCITAPRSALQSENGPKLPVLFYVHGGGFMCGSQSTQISGREIWDGVNLARSALARSDGIIVITINYRVGPLGFLASNELAAYNSSFDEPVGNYGLHDQRTALKWVSEFISGFGGDPENVTAQGGSAGGASCHFLATFPQTNLKRAIISSGTVLLGFMPIDDRQKQFDRFVQKYNADDTQNQKVSKLQAVPVADFVEEIIGTYCPVIDGVWISSKTIGARADLTNPPDLMIGSCTYEQDSTLAGLESKGKDQTGDIIREKLKSMAKPLRIIANESIMFGEALTKTYGLEKSLQNPEEKLEVWAEFIADLMFRVPPLFIAQHHQGSKVFLYDFQSTNPFRGWPLGYNKANHAISDLFFFNAGGDLVESQHKEAYDGAVNELQSAWIDFCYGKYAWAAFKKNESGAIGPIRTFENGGKGLVYQTLEEFIPDTVVRRWRTALNLSDYGNV